MIYECTHDMETTVFGTADELRIAIKHTAFMASILWVTPLVLLRLPTSWRANVIATGVFIVQTCWSIN